MGRPKLFLFKLTLAVIPVTLFSGCGMLESHPYDVNISGEKHLTEKNTALIEEMMMGREEFTFAMISDTQRGYDETADAVNVINGRPEIEFVLHGGDMTEYGSVRELEWTRDILARLKVPYVSVIGNHDCLGTGLEAYEALFGPLNYSFIAGDVKFVCLNTNALEFDYSVSVPDFRFLKNELAAVGPEVSRTVALMHAGPMSDQFGGNTAEEFHALLRCFPALQFCLYGHGHHVEAADIFHDGIMYYECANIRKRSFLVFTIRKEGGYDYEVVEF